MTCTLDGNGQFALVTRTSAGNSPGKNFSSLRDIAAQLCDILVIDGFYLINTETANLSAALATSAALGSFASFGHGKSLLYNQISG